VCPYPFAFQSSRSAYASLAFCKHPDLNTPGRPARLCGKKYYPSAVRVEIFFQQTRRARSCPDCTGVQKFACEKASGEKLEKLKELSKA